MPTVLVTGNTEVVNGDNNTKICFKNCSPFIRCVTHLNDKHIETAEHLDLIMNLYNLIEYSDYLFIIQTLQDLYFSLKEMNSL